MNFKDILYSLLCLSFSVIIGGAIYEHLAVVPQWTAAPPRSLAMFQGDYGLKPETFWKLVHPITMLLFVITLIFFWKRPARRNVLAVFVCYLIIIAVTAIYFVPELLEVTTTAYSDAIDTELTGRASMWEALSLVRLAVLIVLSIVLFNGLKKMEELQHN